MGLVGDVEAEGASREGRAASGGDEEDEAVARSYHDTVLSGKLQQAVRLETNSKGGRRRKKTWGVRKKLTGMERTQGGQR